MHCFLLWPYFVGYDFFLIDIKMSEDNIPKLVPSQKKQNRNKLRPNPSKQGTWKQRCYNVAIWWKPNGNVVATLPSGALFAGILEAFHICWEFHLSVGPPIDLLKVKIQSFCQFLVTYTQLLQLHLTLIKCTVHVLYTTVSLCCELSSYRRYNQTVGL